MSLIATLAKIYDRAQRRSEADRRRWPRYPIVWEVRLFVDDAHTIVTETVDASLHGLRLAPNDEEAARLLRPGETYRFEVSLSHSEARFARLGEVRHVSENGVGLKILRPLPASIVESPGSGQPDDARHRCDARPAWFNQSARSTHRR